MSNEASSNKAQLQNRRDFMKLDGVSAARLRSLKPTIERELPVALDKFYERMLATPEARSFFSNDAAIAGAKAAQLRHWSKISSADFDDAYIANVRRVGLTHARIGLEPRWYIGGYALIVDHLVDQVVAEAWPKGLFNRDPKEAAKDLALKLGAMFKAVMLDMDMSVSMYIEAAQEEQARQRAEVAAKEKQIEDERAAASARARADTDAISAEREVVTKALAAGLAKLAQNDLTSRIEAEVPAAYAKLKDDFNDVVAQLHGAFSGVAASISAVYSGTQEIAVASSDLSRRTEQQASTLEETAAALSEVTSTVRRMAENTKEATAIATGAQAEARKGGDAVRSVVDAMGGIEKSSQNISQIIGVIDEIAFQTNLLALNAGVEAARAGDAGRGFAVVASEVRVLAHRAASSAKEIKSLVQHSNAQVVEGVRLAAESGKSLSLIETTVAGISKVVEEIAERTRDQATALGEINTAVSQLDQATQQNASMAEEATAASTSLAFESDRLSKLVAQFSLGDRSASTPAPESRRQTPSLSRHEPRDLSRRRLSA